MKYRSDIDGLRAIAVLLVIFFHYGYSGIQGGFIGVDVFFVLSGYLIGSIVFEQLRKTEFTFSDFYFRRVRRLFPAYTIVISLTLLVSYYLMLPVDFREFGQSLLASSIYFSNVLFYLEAGYFDTASHLKPLLHTWSLSVEEQFYLVFPLVAWITYKLSKLNLLIFFGGLSLLSFFAAILYINSDVSAVFYLFPFRAWELLLGTVLAIGFFKPLNSIAMININSFIGLILILVPGFLYTSETLFPGVAALAPCIGTALLIHGGTRESGWVQGFLSIPAVVWIGKISYSLYLWHWPVYVLYNYGKVTPISFLDQIVMLLITFIGAFLSWKFVETPFRRGTFSLARRKIGIFFLGAFVTAVFVMVGFYIHITNGVPTRLNPTTTVYAQAANDLFGDLSDCEEESNSVWPDISYCEIGDISNAKQYTLVWGDSHGGMFKRGLETQFKENGYSALLAWTGGCPPVFGVQKDESVSPKSVDSLCTTRNNAVRTLIKTDPRITSIVLIGRWSYYMTGKGTGVDQVNKIRVWPENSETVVIDQAEYFSLAIMETISYLNQENKKVFVVEQPPEFPHFQSRPLAISLMKNQSLSKGNLERLTTVSYSDVMLRQGSIQQQFSRAESEDLISVLNTHRYFCDDVSCNLIWDDMPLYFDNNHISSLGSMKTRDMFDPIVTYLKTLY